MSYAPRQDLLSGRTILITGAGAGIGRASAISFARHGATVILCGRTVSKLEDLYDEIMDAGLPEPGIAPLDLSKATADEMIELANVIAEQYGSLDGLLHNAAELGKVMPFESYDMNEWMRVMHVNVNAAVLLTRVMLPVMQRSGDASLLFTTSGVGTVPRAFWGAYAVSKHAVEGFAILLADEFENTSNIRTNIISPGVVRTKMRAAAFPNEDPATLKPAEDLMPLYLYLMGPDSAGENGKTFTPDWIDTRSASD